MTARCDVTTLGEALLRLSVPAGRRLETATRFDGYPGGAEANVVVALSRLGRSCRWVGALPDNSLGRLVARHLRAAGVQLDGVTWSPQGRLGTYYVEFSAPPRPIDVIYDRANSCAAQLEPDQVDWPRLLDTRLLHLTGITPALSPGCRAVVTEAIVRAKAAGVAISFDINYRQKLWPAVEAAACLEPLIQNIDLLLCGQADAHRLFGCSGSPEVMVEQLRAFSQARQLVLTLADAGVIGWDGQQFHREAARPVQIIDRIGAGDALAAGVLHGWLADDLGQGLRYGVVLAALALAQYGDAVVTSPAELERLLITSSEGGIER